MSTGEYLVVVDGEGEGFVEDGGGTFGFLDEGAVGLGADFEDDVGVHFGDEGGVAEEQRVFEFDGEQAFGEGGVLGGGDCVGFCAAHW